METVDKEKESLDRFVSNHVLRLVSNGYFEVLKLGLPIETCARYVTEAYLSFIIRAASLKPEDAVRMVTELGPKVWKKHEDVEAEKLQMQAEIGKLMKNVDGLGLPLPKKESDPGAN